ALAKIRGRGAIKLRLCGHRRNSEPGHSLNAELSVGELLPQCTDYSRRDGYMDHQGAGRVQSGGACVATVQRRAVEPARLCVHRPVVLESNRCGLQRGASTLLSG